MRDQLRTHVRLAAAAVVGVATVVGLILALVPASRGWALHHAAVGWVVALVLAVLLTYAWFLWDGAATASQQSARKAAGSAAQQDADHRLAERDATIAELDKLLHPSQRDKELFQELLSQLPWDSGTMIWLSDGFDGKRWTGDQSKRLHLFEDQWQERFFDDETVNMALAALRDAVTDLSGWMAGNGSPDPYSNQGRERDEPMIYTVADGDDRVDGWKGFDKVRHQGEALASALIERRRALEHVGHQRGL